MPGSEAKSLSGVQGRSPWWGSGRSPEVFPILDTPICAFLEEEIMDEILIHEDGCQCWGCLSNDLGRYIDFLGKETGPGEWQVFATITFRTPTYPWQRGFPTGGSGRPKPEFAHHLFDRLILHLESEVGSRLDYVVADQLGEKGGRLHQHAILAAPGLGEYSRTSIWAWLNQKAGWNRILPFEQGAAFYISRYIGRDINRCEWDLRIGDRQLSGLDPSAIGGVVVAQSAPMAKAFFHNTYSTRKR
jgi:hypothetical protein